MKILAPFNKSEEVKELINAGANELYCGILSSEWKKKFTNIACSNLLEFQIGNLNSIEELEKSIRIADSYNTPIFLTLNSWFYSNKQLSILKKDIDKFQSIGIDTFIVTDISFLYLLKKKKDINININLSTISNIFNSKSIEFFKKFNIKRITLPEHLTLKEIAELTKNKNIEFECFILNSICRNISGFCTFYHGLEQLYILNKLSSKILKSEKKEQIYKRTPEFIKKIVHKFKFLNKSLNPCFLRYDIKEINNNSGFNLNINKYSNKNCGLCYIKFLKKNNINHLKIVGRNYSTKKKINDIILVKNFINNKKKFVKNFIKNCDNECYW